MWSAGFRSGAGKIFAAEGLHADDRADLVAVDVAVADFRALRDVRDGRIDAAMDAERESEAGCVDRIDDVVEFVGLPAQNVKHRSEYFVRELRERLQLERARREESAVFAFGSERNLLDEFRFFF